jgi:hypothetical protein
VCRPDPLTADGESIQINIRAGKLPAPEANGVHYIKVRVKLEH